MICQDCKDRNHKDCKGGTWCDCQHKEDLPELFEFIVNEEADLS